MLLFPVQRVPPWPFPERDAEHGYGYGIAVRDDISVCRISAVCPFIEVASSGRLHVLVACDIWQFHNAPPSHRRTAYVRSENWNQLADAIPGAAGPLMKALEESGAYTGNFRDQMADGAITADEFNDALMKLANDPVAVEAAKSTKTFEGAIGGLKATINSGLMTAFGRAQTNNHGRHITYYPGAC